MTEIEKSAAEKSVDIESVSVTTKETNDPNKPNEAEKEILRLSESNRLTKLMVDRPVCMITVSFVVMISISVFVFFMGWLLPNNPHDRDYLVWGDPYVADFDKSKLVAEELLVFDTEDVT